MAKKTTKAKAKRPDLIELMDGPFVVRRRELGRMEVSHSRHLGLADVTR